MFRQNVRNYNYIHILRIYLYFIHTCYIGVFVHFVFSFLLCNSQCFFLQVLGSHHSEGRVKHMVREVLLSCRCISVTLSLMERAVKFIMTVPL